jgi:large subunit ribosomal protein L15
MLGLNNIKAKKGQKKAKYVGRGCGSGIGTTAGRGTKGQKARSGVSGLKKLGMRPRILQTPKLRGFTSMYHKHQIVQVADINKSFKDGDVVNAKALLKLGLTKRDDREVKILGKDKLTVKVTFDGIKLNSSVAEQVKK